MCRFRPSPLPWLATWLKIRKSPATNMGWKMGYESQTYHQHYGCLPVWKTRVKPLMLTSFAPEKNNNFGECTALTCPDGRKGGFWWNLVLEDFLGEWNSCHCDKFFMATIILCPSYCEAKNETRLGDGLMYSALAKHVTVSPRSKAYPTRVSSASLTSASLRGISLGKPTCKTGMPPSHGQQVMGDPSDGQKWLVSCWMGF